MQIIIIFAMWNQSSWDILQQRKNMRTHSKTKESVKNHITQKTNLSYDTTPISCPKNRDKTLKENLLEYDHSQRDP